MKVCIACGMPMSNKEEFAQVNEALNYCVHCAREDGSMQSFEEKREGLTQFIVRTQGLDSAVAREAALHMMRELPAWKEHLEEV